MTSSNGPFTRPYDGFLFDMDGTLINSIAAVERVWGAWARNRGMRLEEVLSVVHGSRAVDTLAKLGVPPEDLDAEAGYLLREEIEDSRGVVPIPGAIDFLAALPARRWAIVTSAQRELALARLAAAGIPTPAILITAEDVSVGKPNPEGYLRAAARLPARPGDCLVFEDAPAGVLAAEAARCDIVVVAAAHSDIETFGHHAIATFESLRLTVSSNGRLSLSPR